LYKYIILFLITILAISCTKEENPASGTPDDIATGFILSKIKSNDWSADEIRASKKSSNTVIKAVKYIEENQQYVSSELNFTLENLSQPGNFGIGEDEPGYQYFVKANYILRSQSSSEDKIYTAYYRDLSVMNITRISDNSLEANFIFKGILEDKSDSIIVSDGTIKINF
jgi:hypothetical protein